MTETTNQATPAAPAATPQATPAGEATPAQSTTTQEPAPANVPYERFKEVNDKYKTLEAQVKEMQDKAKVEEEKRLKEQGDYKKLFEDLQTKYTTEQKTNMKLKLASSKGLPVDLVNRVQGETEEEITKDIDNLLAFMKKETPQGVPPPPKGGSSINFDFANATPAQIREHIAKQSAQQ